MRTGGRTDRQKERYDEETVDFRHFAKVPKKAYSE